MALSVLCLLPLLSWQDPTPAPPVPAAALAAAEAQGDTADLQTLGELAVGQDAGVAARAAWLLGRRKGTPAAVQQQRVATQSPHAEARLHAVQGLLRGAQLTSHQTAVACLDDADRRVRTLAAELLGKLKRPAAVEPLLALLERARTADAGDAAATDLQAALLALRDLGATQALLPAATSLDGGRAAGTGEALAFLFQELSPQLPAAEETTLLCAVLGHREALLRRYAIARLARLGDAKATAALEGRLAQEGAELRPLVELALQTLHGATPDGSAEATGFAAAVQRFQQLPPERRWLVAGAAGGGLLAIAVVALLLRRRRRAAAAAAAAAATAALVAPSAEHLQELAEAEAEAEAAEADTAAADGDAAFATVGADEAHGAGDGR